MNGSRLLKMFDALWKDAGCSNQAGSIEDDVRELRMELSEMDAEIDGLRNEIAELADALSDEEDDNLDDDFVDMEGPNY